MKPWILGMQKLITRNDEIGEIVRTVQDTFSKIGNVVVGIRKASAELGEVSEAFLRQNEKIRETENIFGSLNREVGKVSSSIKEIDEEMEGLKTDKEIIEQGILSLTESAQQNASSAEITTENVEEFGQIVDECNKATETVVQVANELIAYIGEFGEEAIREKIVI